MKNSYARGPYRNDNGIITSVKMKGKPVIAILNEPQKTDSTGNLLAASYEMLNELKRLYKLHGYSTTKAVIRKATKINTP